MKKSDKKKSNIARIEAETDLGSEEAARTLMKLITRELFHGRPLPRRFAVRLAVGLWQFMDKGNCSDILSLKKSVRRIWAKKHPDKYTPLESKKGPKSKTFDEDMKILHEVEQANLSTGRLTDSQDEKPGAFSVVGEKLHRSPQAIQSRYYRARKCQREVMAAVIAAEDLKQRHKKARDFDVSLSDLNFDIESDDDAKVRREESLKEIRLRYKTDKVDDPN